MSDWFFVWRNAAVHKLERTAVANCMFIFSVAR